MNCPSPMAEILLNIIQTGILRMRTAAWTGDAARAAVEADHIHNLPALLKNYSPEALKYYWDVERSGFMSKASETAAFEESWKKLHKLMASMGQPMLVP